MVAGWPLALIPHAAYMLFIRRDKEARRYRWLILGSWILLAITEIGTTVYLLLNPPDWEMLTGIGKDIRYTPYLFPFWAAMPAFFAWLYCRHVEARSRGYRYLGERLGDYIRKKKLTETVGYLKERGFLPFCAFCGSKLTEGQLFCGNCGRKIETQPFQPPASGSAPMVTGLSVQPRQRPLAASLLSLIGAAVILLLGVWYSNRPQLSRTVSQLAFAMSFLTGIPILCLVLLLIKKPNRHEVWGVLIIVFSALSFLSSGGLFVGMTLGIVGGALAIAWKQK